MQCFKIILYCQLTPNLGLGNLFKKLALDYKLVEGDYSTNPHSGQVHGFRVFESAYLAVGKIIS